MPAAVDPEAKVACLTPQHLQSELESLTAVLSVKENEDTWQKLEKGLIRFAAITRGGGYKHLPQFVDGVGRKGVGLQVVSCMLSERGKLSGVATELLQTLAPRLGQSFAPLVNLYLETIVKLLGRPNKVFLKRAEKCLLTIVGHCHVPSVIIELRRGVLDEAVTCRRGCAAGLEKATKEWEREIWGEKELGMLEESLKKLATDKDPEVRQSGKRIWARFLEVWPERVDDFSAPLTPTIRRYLDISNTNGPAKLKAASKPTIANKPILATVSSTFPSAATMLAPPAKPQHLRVEALVAKPIRLVVAQSSISSSRSDSLAAVIPLPPSPPKQAPPVAPVVSSIQPSPETAESSRDALSRSTTETSRPGPAAFSKHGRSVSHQVLPTASLSDSPVPMGPPQPRTNRSNPLGVPSRPHLPNSYSMTALHPEASDHPALPPRRFAPPARIFRQAFLPATTETGNGEDVDPAMLYATPVAGTILRGPTRPPPGQTDRWGGGLGKRSKAFGQAQRRVVTAPGATDGFLVNSSGLSTQTPGLGNRTLSRSLLGNETLTVTNLPIAETSETTHNEGGTPAVALTSTRINIASPTPDRVGAVDSPLLPVLLRSIGKGEIANGDMSIDLLQDTIMAILPSTIRPDRLLARTGTGKCPAILPYPASRDKLEDDALIEEEESILKVAITTPLPIGSDAFLGSSVLVEAVAEFPFPDSHAQPVIAPAEQQLLAYDPSPTPIQSDILPNMDIQPDPISQYSGSKPSLRAVSDQTGSLAGKPVQGAGLPQASIRRAPVILDSTQKGSAPLPPTSVTTMSERPTAAVAASAKSKPVVPAGNTKISAMAAPAAARLPKVAVPASRTAVNDTSKPVRSVSDKGGFKPTTGAAAAKEALAKAGTAKLNTTARVVSLATGSGKVMAAAAPAVAKPTAPSVTSVKPIQPAPPVAIKPAVTMSSTAKPMPTTNKTSTKPDITRPTVRSALSASAASSSARPLVPLQTSKAHAKITLPPIKKEKIRLKAPLPSFVPQKRNAPTAGASLTASSTSNVGKSALTASTRGHAKGVVAKVRPETIPLPLSPADRAKLRPAEIALPKSPLTVLSPTSARQTSPLRPEQAGSSDHSPTRPLSSLLSTAQAMSSPTPCLPLSEPADFPFPQRLPSNLPTFDRFATASLPYASSKASTSPPGDDSDSDSDDEDDDPLNGVTFKSHPPRQNVLRSKAHANHIGGKEDLQEISAPFTGSKIAQVAQGQRADISTPHKGVETALKVVGLGGGTPRSTPGRAVLSRVDVNLGVVGGEESGSSGV